MDTLKDDVSSVAYLKLLSRVLVVVLETHTTALVASFGTVSVKPGVNGSEGGVASSVSDDAYLEARINLLSMYLTRATVVSAKCARDFNTLLRKRVIFREPVFDGFRSDGCGGVEGGQACRSTRGSITFDWVNLHGDAGNLVSLEDFRPREILR